MAHRWGTRTPDHATALVDGRLGFIVRLGDEADSDIDGLSVLGSFDQVEGTLTRLGVRRVDGAHWRAIYGGWLIAVEPLA